MLQIRLPNFNGKNEKEKLEQIQKFLFNLVNEINYNFSQVEKTITEVSKKEEL